MKSEFRSFASDNNSGVHPRVMEAIIKCNTGHAIGYGDDDYTRKAIAKIEALFGPSASAFFVFNGTGANITGLLAATNSFNAIICSETAHINVDECGAPEKFTGCKLLTIPTIDGKLTPNAIKKYLHGFDDQHHAQPKVVSISQTTELGTLYKPTEIKAIADIAHQYGMFLHMDGARLSNAAASLGLPFKEFTTSCGVDFVSFGGTKNGLMYGEAVVFLNKSAGEHFKFIRKQGMQLASKMRYISAQFLEFLTDDLYLTNAGHSNKMAQELVSRIKDIPEITITQPVEANGIFAIIPPTVAEALRKHYFFYTWDEDKSEVRWMTSFDTTLEDIEGFVYQLKQALKK